MLSTASNNMLPPVQQLLASLLGEAAPPAPNFSPNFPPSFPPNFSLLDVEPLLASVAEAPPARPNAVQVWRDANVYSNL